MRPTKRRPIGLASQRTALRRALGAGADDVVVLSVARLAPEKGLDVLVHAVAEAADARLVVLEGATHFFHGRLRELSEHVESFVEEAGGPGTEGRAATEG